MAAGFVRNRLGHALIHLQAEWDRCDKPAKRSAAWIASRAAELPDKKGRPDHRRAAVEALVWHASAMRQRAVALSGRNLVLGLLGEWAAIRGVDPDLLSPAVFHWLAPTCGACEGTGKKPVLYGKEQSKESCKHCHGEGTWPRPLGAHEVQSYIKRCLGDAKRDMARAYYGRG
jgi:hypothetical protein